jgi:hypothetical protein
MLEKHTSIFLKSATDVVLQDERGLFCGSKFNLIKIVSTKWNAGEKLRWEGLQKRLKPEIRLSGFR